jgi:hypothetical protein
LPIALDDDPFAPPPASRLAALAFTAASCASRSTMIRSRLQPVLQPSRARPPLARAPDETLALGDVPFGGADACVQRGKLVVALGNQPLAFDARWLTAAICSRARRSAVPLGDEPPMVAARAARSRKLPVAFDDKASRSPTNASNLCIRSSGADSWRSPPTSCSRSLRA